MLEGRLVQAKGGFYYVATPHGETICCRARGKLKDAGRELIVGDSVSVLRLPHGDPVIEAVYPRKNRLKRPPVANVDQVIALMSVFDPPLDLTLLDRIIVSAEAEELTVIICLNKIDLATPGVMERIEEVQAVFEDCSYRVVPCSALSGQGLEIIQSYLEERVTVLAGPSGTGKSTLINQLIPGANLQVAAVSKKSRRGKHTTREVQLIPWKRAGYIVDTPGFQRLDLEGVSARELHLCFPDLAEHAHSCRFDNCYHEAEPQCAVKEALQAGELASWRYEHYLSFLQEIRRKGKKY